MATHRSRKGLAVKNFDHALWERELAEHLNQHPDLQHLPPPVFPQRSQFVYLLALTALVFVLVPVSAVAGWWIGLHLI
jgi:hypothetical protein